MNDSTHHKVDFDEYADTYEKLLQDQLNFFSSDRGYFSKYKADLLKSLIPIGNGDVLDFGAGIGLMIPHLQAAYPDARLHASDISEASLAHLSRKFPNANVLSDASLDDRRFDLILIATVMHHVEPAQRRDLLSRLGGLLKPGGRICIFEHNPYNPVTQRMVSTCPFDEDAVLLPMRETIDLLRNSARLHIENKGYTLFFPPSMSKLGFAERLLRWLPLGGQYYVIARA